MTVQEIAQELVDLCRQGKFMEAQEKLYSPNTRSIEPEGTPGNDVRGMDALKAKDKMFNSMFEVHSIDVSDPIVAGNFFTLRMTLDTTMKESGQRVPMEEIAVYEVNDGKIVLEQFFYPAQQQV
ncbi:MAG: nuclear transport factor 2 family protein [Microscillaceae bacterium]|nr:nuclear transport factor 2 family protein [Microscillaceae bacterium]